MIQSVRNAIFSPNNEQRDAQEANSGAFACLPDELMVRLFSEFDSPKEIATAGMACQRFCRISQDDSLWQNIYVKYLSISPESIPSERMHDHFNLCKERVFFTNSLKTGKCKERIIQLYSPGSQRAITATRCFKTVISGNYLLCDGKKDGEIAVWDLETGKQLYILSHSFSSNNGDYSLA